MAAADIPEYILLDALAPVASPLIRYLLNAAKDERAYSDILKEDGADLWNAAVKGALDPEDPPVLPDESEQLRVELINLIDKGLDKQKVLPGPCSLATRNRGH